MKCDLCDLKATVFYTQVEGGEMKKTALCEACADAQGVTDPAGLIMGGVFEGNDQPDEMPFPISDQAVCSQCGFRQQDFQKVGRLGCPACYQTFRHEIEGRLRGMHRGVNHLGRIPEGMMEVHARRERIQSLERNIEKAVASEDYEEAARLRDEIRSMRAVESGGGS